MAASSAQMPISSSTAIIDSKAASPQRISLPTLAPARQRRQAESWKTRAYRRKIARNVKAMATGEAPYLTATAPAEISEKKAREETSTELPEIVQTVQQTWEKVEDKYAVASLGLAAVVALWGTIGLISAIDKLPLIPGALELVGIGYTGWFAYKNVIFKPDREALLAKIKASYNDIIGSS